MFKPKILELFTKGYSRKTFLQDLSAGLIVGVVAIPLAVAFAIASGVTPDKGLLTAVIAGFIISALGGSQVQIGGPTGAFIVIIYGILSRYGPEGLLMATIMAGGILLVLGFARLGTIIQFIPFPVIVGFTSGIAVIIFSSQVNDFLGLGLQQVPADFLEKWQLYLSNLGKTNPWALALSLGTIGSIVLLLKVHRRIPAALAALVAGTVAVAVFKLPVETIGSRFGEISGSIPLPTMPHFQWETIKELLLPAFSIAMLAGIESLLSAVVADGMTGKKHDSNTELVAQGFANIASALFGGLPATGAIARTATNVKSGGVTPVAGIVHAVFLLGVLLFLSPLAGAIPLAVLAGILITVSYNMSEHRVFRMLLKGPRTDILVLIATFLLTVLVDLTIAIPIGIMLALLGFVQKMSVSSEITRHSHEVSDVSRELDPLGLSTIHLPQGVEVYEIEGPFFFGAAERFKEAMQSTGEAPLVLIIRMRHVPSIDASGIMALHDVLKSARDKHTRVLFSGARESVRRVFAKTGLDKVLGMENLVIDFSAALERAQFLVGREPGSLAAKLARGAVVRLQPLESHIAAIRELAAHAPLGKAEQDNLLAAVIAREELSSTAVGHGMAFPHPTYPMLKHEAEEFVLLAYLETPVDFHAADGQLVKVLFLVASSSSHSHLQTLSRLGRLLKQPDFLILLENRVPMETILAYLNQHP